MPSKSYDAHLSIGLFPSHWKAITIIHVLTFYRGQLVKECNTKLTLWYLKLIGLHQLLLQMLKVVYHLMAFSPSMPIFMSFSNFIRNTKEFYTSALTLLDSNSTTLFTTYFLLLTPTKVKNYLTGVSQSWKLAF